MIVKSFQAQMGRKSIADDIYTAAISTDAVDADGEVLIPAGCNATEFDSRQTIFWNHDPNRPIAGAVGKVRRYPKFLESDFRFARRPENHHGEWFADTVRSLVDQVIVRGASVGFDPMIARAANEQEKQIYGPEVKRIHHRWKLFEWSITPLQCNPEAVIRGVQQKSISADVATMLNVTIPEDTKAAPDGKTIQTLIFSRHSSPEDVNGGAGWDADSAAAWAKEHDFSTNKVEVLEPEIRIRQFNPDECDRDSYITLSENFPAGISAGACHKAAKARKLAIVILGTDHECAQAAARIGLALA